MTTEMVTFCRGDLRGLWAPVIKDNATSLDVNHCCLSIIGLSDATAVIQKREDNGTIILPRNEFRTQVSSNWKPSEHSLCWCFSETNYLCLWQITQWKNFPLPKTILDTFSYFSAFFCADERRSAAHACSGSLVCVLNIWRNGAKEERGRRGWTRMSRFLLSESVEEKLKFICAKLRNPSHVYKNLHLKWKLENENFLKYITICSTRPEYNRIMMFRDFFSDMRKPWKVSDNPELWFIFAAADNDIFFQNRYHKNAARG